MERAGLSALSLGQATAFCYAHVPPPLTELPWHTHPMPNAAYVLSGQLTIQDKETVECYTVHAGEALNETTDSAHRGYTLDDAAELVIFYAGVEGQPLSVPLSGEAPEF